MLLAWQYCKMPILLLFTKRLLSGCGFSAVPSVATFRVHQAQVNV